jgi:excisionase family DNA binding protein
VLADTSPSQAPAQGWLTPKDLQTELRIGEKLCYRLLRSGDIPSVRVGNLYRVRREALEDLKNHTRRESLSA